MRGDIEIIAHLVDSMLKSANELEKSVAKNNIELTSKIKKQILDIRGNLSEELK